MVIRVDCLFLAGGLSQLSAAAIARFPFVCVLALSIQNGKPLYCGKLRVSVYPIGALKDRWLTGRPMVLRLAQCGVRSVVPLVLWVRISAV